MHKYITISIFIILASSFTAYAQLNSNNTDNNLKTELLELSSKIQQDAVSKGLQQAFKQHAFDLLSSWQVNASDEISNGITIIREKQTVGSRIRMIDQLAQHGVEARGAALVLAERLGSSWLERPGDIFRIFGAKDVEEGRRAANALSKMNKAGVIALIYADEHRFPGENIEKLLLRTERSREALEIMTGKELGFDDASIEWLINTDPDQWMIANVEPEIKNKSRSAWFDNEFLWCLIIGAVIYFLFSGQKK